jgi:predicted XRE-type DNA-binding protein
MAFDVLRVFRCVPTISRDCECPDFARLTDELESRGDASTKAKGLVLRSKVPEKHSLKSALTSKIKKKLSSKSLKSKKDVEFLEARQSKLDEWLQLVCDKFNVQEMCEEPALEEFFEAFWHLRSL